MSSSNRTQFYTGQQQQQQPAASSSHRPSTMLASASASASSPEDLVSPLNLRHLVLNYLLHSSYVHTATALANDIQTTSSSYPDTHHSIPPPHPEHHLESTELDLLAVRKQVRDAILAGHIPLAIQIINSHFPTVLNPTPPSKADVVMHAAAAQSRSSSSSLPAFNRTADSINPNPSSSSPSSSSSGGQNAPTLPDNPTSLDPAHLSLNLQIQDFIESVRAASQKGARAREPPGNGYHGGGGSGGHYQSQTAQAMSSSIASLASTSSCASASTALSRPTSPIPAAAAAAAHHHAAATSSSSAASSSLHHQATAHHHHHHSNSTSAVLYSAIAHAQSLYRAVDALPSYWQALYRKELEKVTSLLAYTELEGSPVKQLLHPNRRVALAEQINSAILYRTGRPSQPLIETAARQTSYVWAQLATDRIAVPAGHPLLAAMSPSSSSTSNTASGGGGGGGAGGGSSFSAAGNTANASSATLAGLNSSLAALVQASHANTAGTAAAAGGSSTSTSASKSDQRRGATGPSSSTKETGKVLQSWNLSSFLNSR